MVAEKELAVFTAYVQLIPAFLSRDKEQYNAILYFTFPYITLKDICMPSYIKVIEVFKNHIKTMIEMPK